MIVLLDQHARASLQRAALISERDVAGRAVEQSAVEAVLQARDQLRNLRGRDAQPTACLGESAQVGNIYKNAQFFNAIKATHPDFRYQPLSPPEVTGDGGRVRWVSGSPGQPPAYAGTDFIIARDGKIAAVYLFFDKLP